MTATRLAERTPHQVASAQVKTAVLFAGLYADGETTVREPVRTRDHTELALREFGAEICVRQREIRIRPRPVLRGLQGLTVIGGDVCEVSPPLDPTGHTALNGANLMFEILCLVAETVARRKGAA